MRIEIQNLRKVFRKGPADIPAVDDVSVVIESGDFAVLWGLSGSGKTTLLSLIGGLDKPSSGKLTVDGLDLSEMSREEMADYRREKVGFIFQSFKLLPTLTVLENVMVPLIPVRMSLREKRKRAMEAIEQVDMTDRMSHLPGELSGGQQQRVAIGRALINDPDLILADEPTSDLDTKTGEKVIEIIAQLNERGKTVVLATHDHRIADKASCHLDIEDGKVVNGVQRE
jgi:putative ABC transport system ATP-binding protein